MHHHGGSKRSSLFGGGRRTAARLACLSLLASVTVGVADANQHASAAGPVVEVVALNSPVVEGSTSAAGAVRVYLLTGPAEADISFHIETSDGSPPLPPREEGPATAGSDYTASSIDLTIPAGESSATLLVPVTGDPTVEINEVFTATVSDLVGATFSNGSSTNAVQVVIEDDDSPHLSTVAGSVGSFYVAADASGHLFATNGCRVEQVHSYGVRTTVAGTASCGFVAGVGDGGPATQAPLAQVGQLSFDGAGNLYFSTTNCDIRRVDPAGIISTIASGLCASGGSPHLWVAAAPDGTVYVHQYLSTTVKVIPPGGSIQVLATDNQFFLAEGLATDGAGVLVGGSGRLVRVSPGGAISVIAGTGDELRTPAELLAAEGGPATSARVGRARYPVFGPGGVIYLSESIFFRQTISGVTYEWQGQRVRRIDPDGTISTVAGGGNAVGCPGRSALASVAGGGPIAVDPFGSLFITASDRVCVIGSLVDDAPPAPDVVITSGPDGLTDDPHVVFAFDATGSINSVACQLTDGPAFPCTSPVDFGSVPDGARTFTVTATGYGGGRNATRSFTVDTTAPVVTVTGGPPASTTDATPTFTFSVTDLTAITATCRIDGGAPVPCTSSFTAPTLAEGAHAFTLEATDALGHTSSSSWGPFTVLDQHLTLDAGPDITVDEVGGFFSRTVTASDPQGDPLTFTYHVSAGPDVDPGGSCVQGFTSGSFISFFGCPDDGTTTVTVTVTDGTDTVTDTFDVVVANRPPTVDVVEPAADLVVNPGTTVSFAPAITDPSFNDTVAGCSIDFGDGTVVTLDPATTGCAATHVFAVPGTFEVVISATDDDGGRGQATRRIIVRAPEDCTNGIDDNGNGLADFDDPDCVNLAPEVSIDAPDQTEAILGTAFATVTDPEGDPFVSAWTLEMLPGFDAGSVCGIEGPADQSFVQYRCSDDGTVRLTHTVTTRLHTVVRTADVAVVNAVPGAVESVIDDPPDNSTWLPGQPVPLSYAFSDPTSNFISSDDHDCTIDWGDGSTSTGVVTHAPWDQPGIGGLHFCDGTHAFGPGRSTITVTVTDDDGASTTASSTVNVLAPEDCDTLGDQNGDGHPDATDPDCTNLPPEPSIFGFGSPEGLDLLLFGQANDPEFDIATPQWTIAPGPGVDAGATCTISGGDTFYASARCTDDGTWVATLTVATRLHSATVTRELEVVNLVPDVVVVDPLDGASVSGPVTVEATFGDYGANDTHTCEVDWGDGAVTSGVVVAGNCTATHAYDDPGPAVISVTVVDDDGGAGVASITVEVIDDPPPVLDAGPDASGVEGGAVALDPDLSSPLITSWSWSADPGPDADAGATCTFFTVGVVPLHFVRCTDDGAYTLTLTADHAGTSVADTVTLSLTNAPPTAFFRYPDLLVVAGEPATTAGLEWDDPGANDTVDCTVDWGDGSPAETLTSVSSFDDCDDFSHTYPGPGDYTATATVTDDDGASSTAVLRVHVDTPTVVDAGPDGAAPEGSPVTLTGTATDPDPHGLTSTWSVTPGPDVDPGATCSIDSPTFLTTAVTCTDDGTYTATLTVESLGGLVVVSDSVTLTISNAVPVVLVTAPPGGASVGTGQTLTVTASFTDAGANDTHTCEVAWGDGSASAGVASAGSCTATHSYVTPGGRTITATVTDDDGGPGSASVGVIVEPPLNEVPVVDAGPDRSGPEGAAVAVTGSASDPEGVVVTSTWTVVAGPGVDAGATCAIADPGALSTTIACTDDGAYTATLTASDGVGSNADSVTLTISNAVPVVTITAPVTGANVETGQPVPVTATFTDAGANDSHTCEVVWGDGAITSGTVSAGTCTASHSYASPGDRTVTVTVADDDAAEGAATVEVEVVSDPPPNQPPLADAGGDQTGAEGAAVTVTGTVSDPDGDVVTSTWAVVPGPGVDPGATCAIADPGASSTAITCTDDGVYTATLTVSDGLETRTDTVILTIANAVPSVTITSPAAGTAVGIGVPVTVSVVVGDAGANDTHTCEIEWGDGSPPSAGTVVAGICSATRSFGVAGAPVVTVTVVDDDGAPSSASVGLTVNDPVTPPTSVCVALDQVKLVAFTSMMTGLVPLTLTAGAYDVTLTSFDPTHPTNAGAPFDQLAEEWYLELLDASGNIVARSATIEDLPEDQLSITRHVGLVIVPDGVTVTHARAVHAHPLAAYSQSVYATLACLELIGTEPD